MNDEWRLSYSGTIQASGDDLRASWRLENEVPAIPAIGVRHHHNWIRGVKTLKVNVQMAAENVVWHRTELFANKKDVGALFACEQARLDDPWTVMREDRNADNQKPPLLTTGAHQPLASLIDDHRRND
jgi:hypothetical protein